jgi:hypothetical protein
MACPWVNPQVSLWVPLRIAQPNASARVLRATHWRLLCCASRAPAVDRDRWAIEAVNLGRLICLGIGVLALLVAGCSVPSPRTPPPIGAATELVPTAAPSPGPGTRASSAGASASAIGGLPPLPKGSTVRLTKAPASGELRLHVGDRIVVSLPATRRWAVGVGDPGVLVPVHGRTLPRGEQGLWGVLAARRRNGSSGGSRSRLAAHRRPLPGPSKTPIKSPGRTRRPGSHSPRCRSGRS